MSTEVKWFAVILFQVKYNAKLIVESVFCCIDYMTPNIGIEAAPAMHMYSTPTRPQSIAQGSPRCGSVVYYNQTPGYSCGPRVCAPSYVQPPQGVDTTVASTPPWIYTCPPPPPSPVTSTAPYPYQASHPPFVPSPSGYPIVCPPVVFYPMYPPQMSPRLPQEDAPSTRAPAHQRSFSSAYPSTVHLYFVTSILTPILDIFTTSNKPSRKHDRTNAI